jgi:hypothetical protein
LGENVLKLTPSKLTVEVVVFLSQAKTDEVDILSVTLPNMLWNLIRFGYLDGSEFSSESLHWQKF